MLPVSGAAQLSASGAIAGLRPVISASGAYCRLVRPAPAGWWARNRFHSPWRRACALQLVDDRRALPDPAVRLGLGQLRGEDLLGREHVLVHEGLELCPELLGPVVVREIHAAS